MANASPSTLRLAVAGALSLLLQGLALAERPMKDDRPVAVPRPLEREDESPTAESPVELPPPARTAGMLPLYVGAGDASFFVDPSSIAVAGDGIVRYVVLARSSEGAENISFEGIRCEGREVKLYAVAGADGQWRRTKTEWGPIPFKTWNNYRQILFSDIFCPRRQSVANAAEAVNALKRGRNPRAEPNVR